MVDSPLPFPCPTCKVYHWLCPCPKPKAEEMRKECAANRARRNTKHAVGRLASVAPPSAPAPPAPIAVPQTAIAHLLKIEGIEAWLSTLALFPPTHTSPPCTHRLPQRPHNSLDGGERLPLLAPPPLHAFGHGGTQGQVGLRATGVGTVHLRLASGKVVALNQTLLIPGIPTKLISVGKLFDLHSLKLSCCKGAVLTCNSFAIATSSRLSNRLYCLNSELVLPSPCASALLASSPGTTDLVTWHRRFADLSPRLLKLLSASKHH
ncbi:hypothetical protein JCM8547_006025 [Rhodosporidiobolus lusitaniae]